MLFKYFAWTSATDDKGITSDAKGASKVTKVEIIRTYSDHIRKSNANVTYDQVNELLMVIQPIHRKTLMYVRSIDDFGK